MSTSILTSSVESDVVVRVHHPTKSCSWFLNSINNNCNNLLFTVYSTEIDYLQSISSLSLLQAEWIHYLPYSLHWPGEKIHECALHHSDFYFIFIVLWFSLFLWVLLFFVFVFVFFSFRNDIYKIYITIQIKWNTYRAINKTKYIKLYK